MWWMVGVVSVLVGAGRFLIPGHELSWAGTYEAFAHIWVGVLLVFCFERTPFNAGFPLTNAERRKLLAVVSLVIITAIEVVAFMRR